MFDDGDLDLVAGMVTDGIRRAGELIPVPSVQSATVAGYDAATGRVTVDLDSLPGAPAPPSLSAKTVTPAVYVAGDRVSVLWLPPTGALILGPIGAANVRNAGAAALGEVAYNEVTASQLGIVPTAVTLVTGMAVTWQAVPGRKYLTHAYLPILVQNTAAATVTAAIEDGTGTRVAQNNHGLAAGFSSPSNVWERIVYQSTAALLTREVAVSTNAGTLDLIFQADIAGFVTVHDIGPA